MMETLDLIGKVLCILFVLVCAVVLIVLAVWMIHNLNDKG